VETASSSAVPSPPAPSAISVVSEARASATASFLPLLWSVHRHLRVTDRTRLVMLVATSGGQSSAGSASCPASTSAKSSSNASSHLLKHTQRRPAGERDEQPDAKRPAVGGRGVLATFDDVGSRYPWMRYSAVDGATLLAASEPGGGRVQRPSL